MLTTKMQALEERCGEMERTKSSIMRQKNKSAEIQQFEKVKGERGDKVIIRILMFRVYASERTIDC
jgi:hypothetical protein